MLNGGLLTVTGRGTNVNFTIDDQAPFDTVIAGVEECLFKNRHLFSRGNITVNVGRRILAREQLTKIKRILEAESGLTVAQFWCSPEILEETLSDIGPEQPPELMDEVLDKDAPITSTGLPEYLPDPEYEPDPAMSPARLDLEGNQEPDEARDSPGQTLGWPTPDYSSNPGSSAAASLLVQEEEPVETENEPQPHEDWPDAESQLSPEGEADDYSHALGEPAAQISPESVDDPIPESVPESIKEPIKEPTIEPLMEPSPLELALLGLKQSFAEGGLESGQDGGTASLESRLESLSPEEHEGEDGLRADVLTNTGVGTGISPHRETGGLNRQNEALLIKTTCHSGEVVRYPGDVIILADVNPGAEIIADGDILVFGSLRGLAHAGAGGDTQATIIAMNLESHRIQIGPYIGMAPKAKKRGKSKQPGPTLAFVRRQSIFVAPFKGRFAGYSGGTIYDG